MEAWAQEEYVGATHESTLLYNTKALGGLDVLRKVISLVEEKGQDDE